MVLKDGAVRMTISMPADLKARIDATKENVNWSAVAAKAFEEKLADIANQKARKTVSDKVQRLRASHLRAADEHYAEGEEAGREWAGDVAEAHELQKLASFREKCGPDWHGLFEDNPHRDYHPAHWIYFQLYPHYKGDRGLADEFWNEILGEDNKTSVEDLAWLKGFCEGAVIFWNEVKDDVTR